MKELLDGISVERLEFYANNEPPFGYTGSDIQTMARIALAVKQADLSSLKRYDLNMDGCDSCGQDCGADMTEDREGDYVLFADVVPVIAAAKTMVPVSYTSADALEDVACGLTSMMGPKNAVGSIPLYTTPQPETGE